MRASDGARGPSQRSVTCSIVVRLIKGEDTGHKDIEVVGVEPKLTTQGDRAEYLNIPTRSEIRVVLIDKEGQCKSIPYKR